MTRLRGTFAALAIAGTLCPAGADVPLGVSVSFGALDAIRERPGTDFRVEGDAGFWGKTGAFVGFGWSTKEDVVDAYAGLRRYVEAYGRGTYGGISAGGRFVGEAGPEWNTAAELGWEGRYGGMLGLGFAFQAALRDVADRENRRIDVSLSARMRATAPDDSREYAAYLWTREPGDKWVKLSAYPPGAVLTTRQFETLFDLELGLAPGIAAAFQWAEPTRTAVRRTRFPRGSARSPGIGVKDPTSDSFRCTSGQGRTEPGRRRWNSARSAD